MTTADNATTTINLRTVNRTRGARMARLSPDRDPFGERSQGSILVWDRCPIAARHHPRRAIPMRRLLHEIRWWLRQKRLRAFIRILELILNAADLWYGDVAPAGLTRAAPAGDRGLEQPARKSARAARGLGYAWDVDARNRHEDGPKPARRAAPVSGRVTPNRLDRWSS